MILSSWKKAGLFPYCPEVVIKKMKVFDSPTRPITPPQQIALPFANTPLTRDRPAFQQYLENRLVDHYCNVQPLSPGWWRSWRKFMRVTEPKMIEASLIKEREHQRIAAQQAQLRRKAGSRNHVQKNGVIYVGAARSQIQERQETVVNMAIERHVKAAERVWKTVVRKIEKDKSHWQSVQTEHISYFKSYVLRELLLQIFYF